ncbi:MAG TPA: HD domain-containing phosphohydrolase [Vicinamibacterales bacterium]|nr:HD domain-containing phosphohydrolase [Vicinamibacterales bacterium]
MHRQDTSAQADQRHPPSVLLVDDDEMLRGVVRSWVEEMGFEAREAASADHALDELDMEPAQIAVCDVNMPGRTGVWLASQIRERYPDTAIVVATAARDVETAVASLRNQVVDYLLKPFDRARLHEALALGRDWHHASAAQEDLHHALQDRLRRRRTDVAAALAEAQETPEHALEGLMAILQLHERDARGHATRVARLAVSMADELGYRDHWLEVLEHASLLHDVGKLDMPAAILSKPAPLDEYEWRVMRTHPQVGYDLLKNQPRFADAAEIVLAHHEAYDGSGYPRGLSGRRISTAARILAVADAYDSMTHPHTQRPPMTPAMAVEEIARCSGAQFDPECVDLLGKVLLDAMEKEAADAAV